MSGIAMVNEEVSPSSTSAAPSMEDIMKDVHGAVERALNARAEYLIQEAGTLTVLHVRRLLEKDLNVEQGFLDPHKEIIKYSICKLLQGPQAESPKAQEVENEHEESKEDEEGKEPEVEGSADQKSKVNSLKKKTESEGVKDEVMKHQVCDAGVSSTEEGVKKPEVDSPSDGKEVDMGSLILEAIRKRAPYFKSQAESLTVLGVRHLLEQDLSMEKGALDAHKQHIRKALDQVLNTENEEPVPVTNAKKRKAAAPESKSKSNKSGKKRKAASSEEVEENGSSESERAPKVRNGANRKSAKNKVVQEEEEDASGDNDDDGEPSKGDSSGVGDSEDEETERKKVSKTKKLVESKPVYGRKVEHLKSTIKACGITVPPSVYKKAKQAPEERREIVLVKELGAILSKEGLTANASKDDAQVDDTVDWNVEFSSVQKIEESFSAFFLRSIIFQSLWLSPGSRLHRKLNRMSPNMRFFGPKVHDPSRVAKDAIWKLAREQHRRDVCNARLQDLEKEFQMFSEEFTSRLHYLRVFMKDEIFSKSGLRAFSGRLSPDEAKSEGLAFHGQDTENIH